MSVAALRSPAEYESRLRRYLYERCEEGRAVRVGEKEVSEMAEREDALENAILAARVEFQGEELPLRSAQAKLAVLEGYTDRDELGRLTADRSSSFNDDRLDVLRQTEELESEISGEPDPVRRNEDEKRISLH